MNALDAVTYHGATVNREDVLEAFWKIHKLICPPPRPQKERDQLEREQRQIANQLAKARANLPLLDAENIPAAQAVIRQLDARRQELDKELAESKPPREEDVNRMVMATLECLTTLATGCLLLAKKDPPGWHTHNSLRDEAPANIRRFFGLGYHVRIHTERSGRGSGVRHKFLRGELVFKPMGGRGEEKTVGVKASELKPTPSSLKDLCAAITPRPRTGKGVAFIAKQADHVCSPVSVYSLSGPGGARILVCGSSGRR